MSEETTVSNANVQVRVRLSFPTSNQYDGGMAELNVVDEISGETIVAVRLDAEQFTALMGNKGTGLVAGAVGQLDRVGKTLEVATVVVPDGAFKRNFSEPAHEEAAARGWIMRNAPAGNWDSLDIRTTNKGSYEGRLRRWVAVDA